MVFTPDGPTRDWLMLGSAAPPGLRSNSCRSVGLNWRRSQDMNMPDTLGPLDCFLIADDLTGACDAAVQFAIRGRRTRVCLSRAGETSDADVVAVNTDSRDLEREAIRIRLAAVADWLVSRDSARILFKKVDSTLRGNVGTQIATALEIFACEAAVVCTAFPALNRVVAAGILRIIGAPVVDPIDVVARLYEQGLDRCIHVRPGAIERAIASGARIVSLDAVCETDLDEIAAEALTLDRRILWVGSGGLAAALARTMPRTMPRTLPAANVGGLAPLHPKGPVLFCIGSRHAMTVAQQAALAACRNVRMVLWEHARREDVIKAMGDRHHVCLEIPRGEAHPQRIRELIAGLPASALFLTGGDTASLVCQSLRVRGIHLLGEIAPGIPYGFLDGGELDGMMVVTKSGAFGQADALIQIADYFSCPHL